MRTRADLREEQVTIWRELVENPARLVVSHMGSGKTGATLTALRDLLDTTEIRHVLLIAPKFVARNTWPDEFAAWSQSQALTYAVCVGTEAERKAALAQDVEITIVNKDVLPWLAKEVKSVRNWKWDCLVVDESSMFKAGKKRTTRARIKAPDGTVRVRQGGSMTRFGVLATARQKVRRVILLTGTPAPNGIEDLWGQIYLLDQGERLGRSLSAFHDRWFDKNRYTHQITPKPGAEAEITKAVSDLIISIPPRKLVDDPVFVPMRVDLPPKIMQQYREFERTSFAEDYDVEAITKGVLANKLLQFSNGSMFREDRTVVPVHTEKLDALDELLERAAGDPMLIFYSYRFDLEAIRKRHPDAVVANENDDFVDRWNRGKIKKLIAHPASIGHGTNLQYGGHLACWFGLPWSLELYQQANARLPRPGQEHQVAIYQIIARGTYDEVQLEALHNKAQTQEAIIQAVMRQRAA
jgi:SNF2 family DNA or RNA helicase